MKKTLTLFVAALLSMGTLMAQSAKQTTRLQSTPVTEQVKAPAMQQSMAKDVLCDWYSNMDATDSPTSAIGGFYAAYSIANYAEKITNSQVLTIDSIGYMMYEIDDNPGSITLAIYDEQNGLPGTSLGSVTVSNWSDFTYEAVALTTPVQVAGNYYIVCTVSDDATAMLTTANRTQATSTAYIQFNGNWQPIYQVLTNNQTSQPFYGSFFLYAHACTADLQGSYTVTANANNPAWGTVTGGGSYNAGATCTLTATPADGYRFIRWQDSVTVNPRSFPVLDNVTYTAYFAEEPNCTYTLPYTCGFETEEEVHCWTGVDGDGDGYEWTWGESTTLGHTGTHYMYSGSYLNTTGPLSPSNWLISPELNIPAGGATLTYWVAPQDQNYPDDYYEVVLCTTGSTDTADFTTTLFTETLTAADYGYTQRTIQITQEGTIRFAFHHKNSYDVYIINLDDISVVANNPVESYTITVNVDNPAHGSATGSGTYYAGTQVTLTATPASGYAFLQWNDGNMQNPRTITVTGDATYTATFAQSDEPEYTITLLAAVVSSTDTVFLIEEEADWSGAGTFAEGSHTTLTVTPKGEFAGVQFLGWQDGNTSMPRTVTVTEDKTYVAYFQSNNTNSINEVEGAEVLRTEYYDVLGRQLQAEPAHGIYLIRTITTQGQNTRKVMKR